MPKKIVGQGHTPKISKGVWQTGTSTGRIQCKVPNYSGKPQTKGTYQIGISTGRIRYNQGPAWQTGHVIVYPNGKIVARGLNFDYAEAELRMMRELAAQHPLPRRREAIEHTRRKLGL